MDAQVLSLMIVAAAVLVQRPQILPLGIRGGSAFLCVHGGLLVALRLLDPAFVRATWSVQRFWGIMIAGYPAEEYAWAFVFGFAWPILVAWGTGAELNDEPFRLR